MNIAKAIMEYLADKGDHCPYCNSKNIMALEQIQGDGGTASCQIECHDCGNIWTDQYTLTGVLLEIPEET